MDHFAAAETLGRAVAKNLGEDFDTLDFSRQAAYRRVGFAIHEGVLKARDDAVSFAADSLEYMMTIQSTPKRWLPGLKEGAQALRTVKTQGQLARETKVPVDPIAYLEAPDPFASVEAGDDDPYIDARIGGFQECGHAGDGGWTCTRPVHPPHWQHFDTDPDWGDGTVLTTWGEDGELTSVHPDILGAEEDDDC